MMSSYVDHVRFKTGMAMAVEFAGKLLQTNNSSSNETMRMSSNRMSANATSSLSRSKLLSSISLYNVTDDMGYTEQCVGPTPPPGLTFPIETVVQKVFEVDGPTTETLVLSCAWASRFSRSCFVTTSIYSAAATSYSTWTRQQRPQLNPYDDHRPCCGMCTVYVSLVDVYYWPVSGANTACLGSSALPVTNEIKSSSVTQGQNNTAVTAVGPDGFT